MKDSYSGIMVYIEKNHGVVNDVSFEILTKAAELSQITGGKIMAVYIAEEKDEELFNKLISYGADQVISITHPLFKAYINTYYAQAFSDAVREYQPETVMIGATSIGRDIAPRIAVHVKTGLTADCTKLEIDSDTGNLMMTRPAFGGNIMAVIACPDHRPQMTTVRPGVFEQGKQLENRIGEVIDYTPILQQDDGIEVLEDVLLTQQEQPIEKSGVLVSCGRGIGSQDKLSNYHKLAKRLNGRVSGSRAIVNLGYIDKNNQVGQTGKTVRPNVYLACGISGAIQHVVGMEESECVIAINRDEKAAIFETSDLGIVGDVNDIVEELLVQLEKGRGNE